MKINSTSYSFINNKLIQEQSSAQLREGSKASIKNQVQKSVAQIQAAANSTGQNNAKVQELLEKFKSGKKLSVDEINYMRKHAPALVANIEQVHLERSIYEQAMKNSPTKMGVHMIALQASQQFSKLSSSEEVDVRAMHLQDAIMEYTATEEYKQKSEVVSDEQEDKKWKQPKANDIGKLYASTSPLSMWTAEL